MPPQKYLLHLLELVGGRRSETRSRYTLLEVSLFLCVQALAKHSTPPDNVPALQVMAVFPLQRASSLETAEGHARQETPDKSLAFDRQARLGFQNGGFPLLVEYLHVRFVPFACCHSFPNALDSDSRSLLLLLLFVVLCVAACHEPPDVLLHQNRYLRLQVPPASHEHAVSPLYLQRGQHKLELLPSRVPSLPPLNDSAHHRELLHARFLSSKQCSSISNKQFGFATAVC
mmetsp:Transcript_25050/g.49299  ORF Transcript_25050/g.49299 Transcript_25050/m.49299 type:complete len:230 (-) Transcript_25050:447-1136(-)